MHFLVVFYCFCVLSGTSVFCDYKFMLKILFFGDIIGSIGRRGLAKVLPKLKKKYKPDLIIANIENLAHGKGITPATFEEMRAIGIDFFTSGNHIFSKPRGVEILRDANAPIIRPANYPYGTPGKGHKLIKVGKHKVLVINLLGEVFINAELSSPFREMDKIISEYGRQKPSAIIVDFHAEATSEKVALGFYLDGRASLVIGTHTHVPTSDYHILPKGTGYITDAGMVGGRDTVIGGELQASLQNFLTGKKHFDPPEKGICKIEGVFAAINPRTRKTAKIERVYEETEVV